MYVAHDKDICHFHIKTKFVVKFRSNKKIRVSMTTKSADNGEKNPPLLTIPYIYTILRPIFILKSFY